MFCYQELPFLMGTSNSSKMSIAKEWSPWLMSTARTRKKAHIVFPLPAAPRRFASIEPEDFTLEVPQSWSIELSSAARKPYHKHLAGIKSVCKIYDVPFKELLDALEQFGEEITEGSMGLFMTLSTILGWFQTLPNQIITGKFSRIWVSL